MKFQHLAILALTQIGSTVAFIPGNTRISQTSSTPSSFSSLALNALPTPEESAKALTAYMAKAHEEKIKALRNLEEKKNGEIAALKSQVDNSSTAIVQSAPVMGDIEVLSNKLVSYQKFMSGYIVKAQEEKARAVKEAEIAVAKKYEAKLNAFMLSPAAESSDAAADESTLYKERNANIAAAAKAGKSRWGDKEVERAGAKAPPSELITPITNIASSSVNGAVPEEVIAADHGLRADGELSLADRVMNGASTPASDSIALIHPDFEKRNAKIAAAAKAGKSRWGDKEVEKVGANAPPSKLITHVAAIASSSVNGAVPEEVIAADHGLRADGGVGGLSLAERVMNGASAPIYHPIALIHPDFEKRNARIAAAAEAGKQSRWGSMEVEKAIDFLANVLPAAKVADVVVLPEVEAADHGLRADGGVGGPSLADRVNLGARLLQ